LVVLTRATLVNVSPASIETVIDALLSLLEELAPFDKVLSTHPPHVLHSEIFVLSLLADCCSAHWDSNVRASLDHQSSQTDSKGRDGAQIEDIRLNSATESKRIRALRIRCAPNMLSNGLVARILDTVGFFLSPLPEDYVLDSSKILKDGLKTVADISNLSAVRLDSAYAGKQFSEKVDELESYARSIIEFVSAANWTYMFNFVQSTLRSLRMTHPPQSSANSADSVEEEHKSLIALRMIADLWVDGAKLRLVLQEVCGSFLHLRRPYQNTVAVVLPVLINRWLENSPDEFVSIHTTNKRLDGGADTLFDMTVSMSDAGRKKAIVWPFQTALLFVNFEVWEVASHLKERAGNVSKKAAFLKDLVKTLRTSRSIPLREAAAYCLVNIMRISRHFSADSESAL
jgi:neurofibromin 1